MKPEDVIVNTPVNGKPVQVVSLFAKGQRVQLHPATDTWMRGDRYGEVVKVGKEFVHVKLDKSGKTKGFHPENLISLEGW